LKADGAVTTTEVDAGSLDNLRFDAVPEPSVLLLGVTAAAAFARRRRPTR